MPKYLVEKILVDGTSMERSLYNGEQVLIEKISRNFDGPERFDVVVFTKNHGTYKKTYIKKQSMSIKKIFSYILLLYVYYTTLFKNFQEFLSNLMLYSKNKDGNEQIDMIL